MANEILDGSFRTSPNAQNANQAPMPDISGLDLASRSPPRVVNAPVNSSAASSLAHPQSTLPSLSIAGRPLADKDGAAGGAEGSANEIPPNINDIANQIDWSNATNATTRSNFVKSSLLERANAEKENVQRV